MQAFLTALLQCSLSMAVLSMAFIVVEPLLSKRYSAQWLYRSWLVIALGWLIPYRPSLDVPFLAAHMPSISPPLILSPLILPPPPISNHAERITAAGEMAHSPGLVPWWSIAGGIWAVGFAVVVIVYVWQHRRFMKVVSRWSEPVTDLHVLAIFNNLKSELNIDAPIALKLCPAVPSPMLIGFWRPTILLPTTCLAEDELTFILKHEFIHFKRHDLWYKALMLLTTALHWFNPVVYLMAKAAAAQCERSCDMLVVQGADFQKRRRYGETIIRVVRNGSKLQTVLSTTFYGGMKGMKGRIFSIMDTTKKKAGMAVLCAVLIAMMATGAVFAVTFANDDQAVGTQNDNVTVDEQSTENEIIGSTKTKQVIHVDKESLEIGQYVAVAGPFTFEEGDLIHYDLQAEGSGHVNVGFRKTDHPDEDKSYLGHSGLTGNSIKARNVVRVNQSLAGTYDLWIGNFDGKTLDKKNDNGVLHNIKGTVTIAVEKTTE